MGDDPSNGSRSKKRAAREEEEKTAVERKDDESRERRKRTKVEQAPSATSLLHLPVELLYSIHLFAKNPAFTILNHHFKKIFSTCPTSIKSGYLLARWHEAYCYGFPAVQDSSKARSNGVRTADKPALPSLPSDDLLEDGSLQELAWSSRFLPVLPTSDFPYQLSNSHQRSADHFILDYCLRYAICNHEVLSVVEDQVLASPEFGNIIFVSGLWRDERGQLCNYDTRFGEDTDMEYTKPCHLIVNDLPRRIFRRFEKGADFEVDGKDQKGGGMEIAPTSLTSHFPDLDPNLLRHLQVFGGGPYPVSSSLLLFLAVISLHTPSSPTSLGSTRPVHSFDGEPLVRSAFAQSMFSVQLLLSLGAEPSRRDKMALDLAIRSGWLEGLVAMVERDEAKIALWDLANRGVRHWFQQHEELRRAGHLAGSVEESTHVVPPATAPKKRRRLLDRAHLDSKMLKEAVKYKRWPIVNWIRSKGVAPDLRTLRLIEIKEAGPK